MERFRVYCDSVDQLFDALDNRTWTQEDQDNGVVCVIGSKSIICFVDTPDEFIEEFFANA